MSSFTCNPTERVLKANIRLQQSHPFFGYILTQFETKPSTDIPTFAVNKFGHLFFNEEFVDTLSDAQLQYVLCHEALHIAKGDFFRVGDRDSMIWNVASDCVINLICNEERLTPPPVGIIPNSNGIVTLNFPDGEKQYDVNGKCTEEIYAEIARDAPPQCSITGVAGMVGSSGSEKGGGNESAQGHGNFDVHLPGGSDDKGNTPEECEGSTAEINAEHKWKKVVTEAAITAQQRGNLPGFAKELVDALLEPKIDWRSRIRSLITNEIPVDYHNRRPGRSFYGTGVWVPQVLRENIHLFLSVDCSGSTLSDRERFISECYGVLGAHTQIKGRLICWDTQVDPANDVEITSQNREDLIKLGLENVCGGTELSSYADYIEERGYSSRMHIILTDGYIESSPRVPTGKCVFVLTSNGTDEIIKQYGEVIHLTAE